jgi:hypothetical protein
MERGTSMQITREVILAIDIALSTLPIVLRMESRRTTDMAGSSRLVMSARGTAAVRTADDSIEVPVVFPAREARPPTAAV